MYEWIREGKALNEIYSMGSTPGDHILSGRRAYVGVCHKPHKIQVYDWPISLIDNLDIGFYSSDFGMKWEFGEEDKLKRVVYHPGSVEYNRIYDWLEIKQILFIPIDEEGFIEIINLKNTSLNDKDISIFVEPVIHLQYYDLSCAPAGTFWEKLTRFDFASVGKCEKQDPGLDLCFYNNKYRAIIAKDNVKKNWTVIIGSNLDPKDYMLYEFKKDDVKDGKIVNKQVSTDPLKTPDCIIKYEIKLRAGETKRLVITVAGSLNSEKEALKTYTYLQKNADILFEQNKKYFTKYIEETVLIETPDKTLDKTFLWSKLTMKYLERYTPGIGTGYHCSFPQWQNYFGRDVLIMLPGTIGVGDFEGARNQLKMYCKFQLPNGEILHELTPTGTLRWHDTDSTPLFIADVAHYLLWTNDLKFVRKIYPNVKKAMEFIYNLDPNYRNLILVRGENSCWGSDPTHIYEPQLLDQIYFYEALKGASEIADKMGDYEQSLEWKNKAEFVKKNRINSSFYYWNEKNRYFCKSPKEFEEGSLAIWPSRGIIVDAYDESKSAAVMDRLESDEFNHDCGFLMTSRSRINFRPLLIWPWTSGIANLAEFKMHRTEQALLHLINMIKMIIIKHYPGSAGDTVDGDSKNFINTWPIFAFAIGSCVLRPVIEGLFGIKLKTDEVAIMADLHMPYHWPYMKLKNLRIRKYLLDLTSERGENSKDIVSVYNKSKKHLEMKIGLNYPIGTKISKVYYNTNIGNEKVDFDIKKTNWDLHVYLNIEVMPFSELKLTIIRKQTGAYITNSKYYILDKALNPQISDSLFLKTQPIYIKNKKTIIDAYAFGGTRHRIWMKYFNKPKEILINGETTDFKYDKNKKILDFSFGIDKGIKLNFSEHKTSPDILIKDRSWKFKTDPDSIGITENWYQKSYDDSKWNEHFYPQYKGIAWFRTKFKVPCELKRKRAFMFFGGHGRNFEIYVNGKLYYDSSIKKIRNIELTKEFQKDEVILAIRFDQSERPFGGIPRINFLVEAYKEEKGWKSLRLKRSPIKGVFDWYRTKFYLPKKFENNVLRLKFYPDINSNYGVTGESWVYINGKLINTVGLGKKKIRNIYIHNYIKCGKENDIVIGIREGNLGNTKIIPVKQLKIMIE